MFFVVALPLLWYRVGDPQISLQELLMSEFFWFMIRVLTFSCKNRHICIKKCLVPLQISDSLIVMVKDMKEGNDHEILKVYLGQYKDEQMGKNYTRTFACLFSQRAFACHRQYLNIK